MSDTGVWIWSAAHGDYYRVAYDGSGNTTYIWASTAQQASANSSQQQSYSTQEHQRVHPRVDSAHATPLAQQSSHGTTSYRTASYSALDANTYAYPFTSNINHTTGMANINYASNYGHPYTFNSHNAAATGTPLQYSTPQLDSYGRPMSPFITEQDRLETARYKLIRRGDVLFCEHDSYGRAFEIARKILDDWDNMYSIESSHKPWSCSDGSCRVEMQSERDMGLHFMRNHKSAPVANQHEITSTQNSARTQPTNSFSLHSGLTSESGIDTAVSTVSAGSRFLRAIRQRQDSRRHQKDQSSKQKAPESKPEAESTNSGGKSVTTGPSSPSHEKGINEDLSVNKSSFRQQDHADMNMNQDENALAHQDCCLGKPQKHVLAELASELSQTPESVQDHLPEPWRWELDFEISAENRGTWTCMPHESDETSSYPLTIAGAPVVLPVDYRWPPMGGVNPPPDPRSSNPISCRSDVSVDVARDIFLTFEGCIGFYLLINGLLQIIVPDEFDTAIAASYMPHTYGGLKVCYIKQTLEPTMFSTRTQTTSTMNVRSMLAISINDVIEASTKKHKAQGRIGLKVVKDGIPYLIMSSHVIAEAITARTLPMLATPHLERLKSSWEGQVEIRAGDVKIGTLEKSYDEGTAHLYPNGYPHDITLVKPLEPSLIASVRSPIADMGWLSRSAWASLREEALPLRLLGPTESHRNAKTLRCPHDSEATVVGTGIFLNVQESGSKVLKELDRSVWRKMVSRAVLYRVSPDFSPPSGYSGIALYADGLRQDGSKGPGIVGFQSFVQRTSLKRNFEVGGKYLEDRLATGRIAFYGAFQIPDELRDYDIAC